MATRIVKGKTLTFIDLLNKVEYLAEVDVRKVNAFHSSAWVGWNFLQNCN